jgi:enamine deaminase RidA (YjgF/YER057c/UK114 family)
MHVQSISGWAPACIGPYAQAVRVGSLLFVAGCLGLEPRSMALPTSDAAQAVLAWRAADAVCRAASGSASLRCALFAATVYVTSRAAQLRALEAHSQLQAGFIRQEEIYRDVSSNDSEDGKPCEPLLLTLLVPALPRGASVEVQPLVLVAEEADGSDQPADESRASRREDGAVTTVWRPRRALRAHARLSCVGCAVAAVHRLADSLREAGLDWQDVFSLRLFAGTEVEAIEGAVRLALGGRCEFVCVAVLAVLGAAASDGEAAALLELTAWR